MIYECELRDHRGERRTVIMDVMPRPRESAEIVAGDAKCMAREYAPGGFTCKRASPLRWSGAMRFELVAVNPKTNEECTSQVDLSAQQVAAAVADYDPIGFIQNIARPALKNGFMPIGGAVYPLRAVPALRVLERTENGRR